MGTDKYWEEKNRVDRFTFEMIDPFNLDISRGFLDNVIAGQSSITFGYDTDTRVSAKITAVNHNYIDYSLIRIHHYWDNSWGGFHEELGTFFVSSRSISSNHVNEETFSLTSMLDRISEDALPYNYPIPSGRTAHAVLKDLLDKFDVAYSLPSSLPNKAYTSTVMYEVGESVLSVIFDVASEANLRIDVNGHGTVIFSEYVPPSSKTSVFDFNDKNGTINGAISINNNPFESVNRVVVVSKNNDEEEAIGYYDVSNSSRVSFNNLGRRNTAVEHVDDLTNFSTDGARTRAKSLLSNYEQNPFEFSFNGIYAGLKPGDVVTVGYPGKVIVNGMNDYLITADNYNYAKASIRNMELSLAPGMLCDYTCKEVM